MNHYPIPTRAKLPSHAQAGDTADAFAAITCPHCRAMLAKKVDAHRAEAAATKSADYRAFSTGTADYWQGVLSGVEIERRAA